MAGNNYFEFPPKMSVPRSIRLLVTVGDSGLRFEYGGDPIDWPDKMCFHMYIQSSSSSLFIVYFKRLPIQCMFSFTVYNCYI